MSELIVIGYDDHEKATAAYNEVMALQGDFVVELRGLAIVTVDAEGKSHVETPQKIVGMSAASGALWGMLIGLLFFVPFFGLALGGLMGALFGKLGKSGINDEFRSQVNRPAGARQGGRGDHGLEDHRGQVRRPDEAVRRQAARRPRCPRRTRRNWPTSSARPGPDRHRLTGTPHGLIRKPAIGGSPSPASTRPAGARRPHGHPRGPTAPSVDPPEPARNRVTRACAPTATTATRIPRHPGREHAGSTGRSGTPGGSGAEPNHPRRSGRPPGKAAAARACRWPRTAEISRGARPDPVDLLEGQAATGCRSWCRSATAGCWPPRSPSSAARR